MMKHNFHNNYNEMQEYEEWLRVNVKPLCSNEIDQLEIIAKNRSAFIIKQPTIFPHPINTFYYQPLQGA